MQNNGHALSGPRRILLLPRYIELKGNAHAALSTSRLKLWASLYKRQAGQAELRLRTAEAAQLSSFSLALIGCYVAYRAGPIRSRSLKFKYSAENT